MKHIIALIKPNMLDDVIFALHKIEGFPGGTVSGVAQIGTGGHTAKTSPGFGFPETKRLEIICEDSLTDEIVQTLAREGHTGLSDDGYVAVSPVEEILDIGNFQPSRPSPQ